jgi:hypothetical protein
VAIQSPWLWEHVTRQENLHSTREAHTSLIALSWCNAFITSIVFFCHPIYCIKCDWLYFYEYIKSSACYVGSSPDWYYSKDKSIWVLHWTHVIQASELQQDHRQPWNIGSQNCQTNYTYDLTVNSVLVLRFNNIIVFRAGCSLVTKLSQPILVYINYLKEQVVLCIVHTGTCILHIQIPKVILQRYIGYIISCANAT